MADIRLFLPDLDAELDVAQDRQFPLALNYTAGSLRDINNRTTNFSLELRIPANNHNKTALKHLYYTNVLDGSSILSKTSVMVKADGIPIFTGDFKLLGSVNDRGHEEFKCILLGDGMDWAEGMRNKTPRSYDWGSISSYDYSTIELYWHDGVDPRTAKTSYNDDGIQFPLINYGAWSGGGGTYVQPQDLKPAMFMRSFFEKAFNAEGYSIQTDTDADDFFNTSTNPMMDRVLFPFTGNGFTASDSAIDEYTITASKDATTVYETNTQVTGVFDLRKAVLKTNGEVLQDAQFLSANDDPNINWNEYNNVFRYYLRDDVSSSTSSFFQTSLNENTYAIVDYPSCSHFSTEQGKVFEILRYGTTTDGFTWVDLMTEADNTANCGFFYSNNFNNVDHGKLTIVSTNIGDGDIIDFDTETPTNAIFDTTTNKFTATNPISARFKFDCWLGGVDYDVANEGIYTFEIIHKRGTTETVIGREVVDATKLDEDPIETIYTSYGNLNLIKIGFKSDQQVLESGDQVWVEVSGTPEESTTGFASLFNQPVNSSFKTKAYVKNASIECIPTGDILENYNLGNIASILDDRYNSLEYIKGCIHAFNLLIDTDPNAKVVRIKTRDDFYDSQANAVDWTSKIDMKKQYVVDYLDDYKQELVFRLKNDSADGYLNEVNKLSDIESGEYTHVLSDRFESGETNMENPLFADTAYMADSLIVNTLLNPTAKGVWMARMWKEYASNSKPPTVSYDFRPRLLYYDYAEQYTNAPSWQFGRNAYTKVPSALPNALSGLMDTPSSDFTVNLSYNNWNESGLFDTYYNQTANTIEKSTKVSIPMRLTFKDMSTLDLTKLIYISQPADLKGYYILDRVKNFLPSANVTTQVELIKKEDYNLITIDTSQDKKDIDFNDLELPLLLDHEDRGSTKWETGKGVRDEDADEAYSRDQSLFVKNDRNIAGIKDLEGALKDSRERKSFKERGEQSAVLANSGNFSAPNSGNLVAGRGNVAIGKNQSLMGKFAEPSTKVTMAVGAGTSKTNRYNAFSVGTDGVVREGQGYLVTEVNGNIEHVWEEVNGELVKIVI
jgi:hypothetical protein